MSSTVERCISFTAFLIAYALSLLLFSIRIFSDYFYRFVHTLSDKVCPNNCWKIRNKSIKTFLGVNFLLCECFNTCNFNTSLLWQVLEMREQDFLDAEIAQERETQKRVALLMKNTSGVPYGAVVTGNHPHLKRQQTQQSCSRPNTQYNTPK